MISYQYKQPTSIISKKQPRSQNHYTNKKVNTVHERRFHTTKHTPSNTLTTNKTPAESQQILKKAANTTPTHSLTKKPPSPLNPLFRKLCGPNQLTSQVPKRAKRYSNQHDQVSKRLFLLPTADEPTSMIFAPPREMPRQKHPVASKAAGPA